MRIAERGSGSQDRVDEGETSSGDTKVMDTGKMEDSRKVGPEGS